MATSETRTLAEIEREIIEKAFNQGDLAYVDETHATDYAGHWVRPDGEDVDRDGLKAWLETIHEGFPDIEFEIEYLAEGEDSVTVAYTATGTHDGEFMGIPATGKHGTTTGLMTHRYEDGKVVEGYSAWDALGMMQQLGVVPEEFHLADFMETAYNLTKQDVLKRARSD